MSIFIELSSLALGGVLEATGDRLGGRAGVDACQGVTLLLVRHLRDQSRKLPQALERANERAWRALELAVAGDSWWNRCKAMLNAADERAFRDQVQAFLSATPLPELAGKTQFRTQCLTELQTARKAQLLRSAFDPDTLAQRADHFAQFTDPTGLIEAEWQALQTIASILQQNSLTNLAWLIAQRPRENTSLLVLAVRYFFRREVETDRELFQGLAFTRLDTLTQEQSAGFLGLQQLLDQQEQKLNELLGHMHLVAAETRDTLLDLKRELRRQNQQMQQLGEAVLGALEEHRLSRQELRPADSLSIRGEEERRLVKALVAKYRQFPVEERQKVPALLNALGKLEAATGDFEAAQQDFQEVATLVDESSARAEAFHNMYQATLECRDWPRALGALQNACRLDSTRFLPFPFDKYEPKAILGAGGFGIAFRCQHRNTGSQVVVKSLRTEGLDRDVLDVFQEARLLEALDHPSIIRLRDCDFADPARTRPYLVMDYFAGRTLADHITDQGPLGSRDLLEVATLMAEGLTAAHDRGVLHRDVKPANVLVRQEGAQWRVKLIDFGLAMRREVIEETIQSPGLSARTVAGQSVVGTVDYAAPEQLGRLSGATIGPYSDVYGFGKTCCHALFGTTQPLPRHFRSLTPALARLLEGCLEEPPANRPRDFRVVREHLQKAREEENVPTLEAVEESHLLTVLPVEPPVVEAIEEVPVVEAVDVPKKARRRPRATKGVSIRLRYKGDWFLFDSSVAVFFDGESVGIGSAINGFDFNIDTTPGTHHVEMRVLFRTKSYTLPLLKEGEYEVWFHYDRIWGTFADRIDVDLLSR